MNPVECEFEPEALAAVLQSRWPDRADAELRAHIAACEICSGVVAVARAFEDARDEMRVSTVVPDAGRIWWRAQLRARREAIEAAGRPITAAQLIASGCAVGLFGACFGATSTWFQSALGSIESRLSSVDFTALIALLMEHGAIVLGMVALVLLVPTAVYVALGRD